RPDTPADLEPVHAWHAHVEQYEVGRIGLDHRERARAVACKSEHAIDAAQARFDHRSYGFAVVDHEDDWALMARVHVRQGIAHGPPASPCPLMASSRRPQSRDHLLLVVLWIGSVVERADEGRKVGRARDLVAEVIADERIRGRAEALAIRRVELRIPAVLGDLDVVPDRRKRGAVELDARADAIVGRAEGW